MRSHIKMDLTEVEWSDMDWIRLGEDREQWRARNMISDSLKYWDILE
jgi:hypothetical protein